jgi:hypothetical protein
MTTRHTLPLLALLAGCPPSGNPHQLWLAPGDSQAQVKLADSEPPPF